MWIRRCQCILSAQLPMGAQRRSLVSSNFPAVRQALEPAPSGRGFRAIAVVFKKFTQSLRRILVLPHRGERLRYEKFDLWRLAVRLSQCLPGCFQRLAILLMMVIRFGQRPLRLPPARFQLQRFLKRGYGLFIFPLIGKRHTQCGKRARVTWVELRGLFQGTLCLRPIVPTEVQHPLHEQDVRVSGSELYDFAYVFLGISEFVVVYGLQPFVEGFLGFGSKERLAGNPNGIVRGRLQVNVNLGLQGYVQRQVLLSSLVSGRFCNEAKIAQRSRDEERASV